MKPSKYSKTCSHGPERNQRLMNYFYGKNVFLTGGSSGIGLATAELLATNGYTVFAASRNPPDEIRSFPGGGEIRPVTLDVRDFESVGITASSVLALSDIGIVIHCAGIGIACAGEDYPLDAVGELMDTNYNGVLSVNSHFLPHLRKRGLGLCIITGSLAGMLPIPYQSHYCASKAALDLYSTALRMEMRDYNVRVCLLMPGDTKTRFTNARKYVISETSPHYEACKRAVSIMEKDEQGGCPPEAAARIIQRLISVKNPPARKIVGIGYKLLMLLRRLLPYKLTEFILRSIYMRR